MSAELKAAPGGLILLPRRIKDFCLWCGAAYERRPPNADGSPSLEGVDLHQKQCRIGVRQRLLQAALSGPLTGKGGAAIVDTVEAVMASVEAGERTSWEETI